MGGWKVNESRHVSGCSATFAEPLQPLLGLSAAQQLSICRVWGSKVSKCIFHILADYL